MTDSILNSSTEADDSVPNQVYLSDTNAYDNILNLVYLIVCALLLILGTLGNLLVIGAVFVHRKLRILSNVFIVNLAVTDLLVSTIVNAFYIVGVMTDGEWFLQRNFFCRLTAALCIIACGCSIWTMFAISVNRYICICHYTVYQDIFNKETIPFFVLGVWVLSLLVDLPAMLGWGKHSYNPRSLHCALDYTLGYDYRLFLLFVGFGFPLNGLLFCYTKIFLFARATKQNLKKFQEKNAGVKRQNVIKTTDLRLLRSILIILIVFVSLWAPYALILLLDTALSWPRSVLITAICMAHVSSSVNSIIYAATNKNFREGYVHLIKICTCYYKVCAGGNHNGHELMIASVDGTQTVKEKRLVTNANQQQATNI